MIHFFILMTRYYTQLVHLGVEFGLHVFDFGLQQFDLLLPVELHLRQFLHGSVDGVGVARRARSGARGPAHATRCLARTAAAQLHLAILRRRPLAQKRGHA